MSKESCELIRCQLASGQYPAAYLDHVQQARRRPRKSPARKPPDYLAKCITGQLLLKKFQRALLPASVAAAPPAPPAEAVLALAEVRQMYEQPSAFARWQEQAPTFEEHLQRIYFGQEFAQENCGGQPLLVLQPS